MAKVNTVRKSSSVVIHASVSLKSLQHILNLGKNPDTLAQNLLEEWAEKHIVKEKVKPRAKGHGEDVTPPSSRYVTCPRSNIRLSYSACDARRMGKKRGCASCKVGKALVKLKTFEEFVQRGARQN